MKPLASFLSTSLLLLLTCLAQADPIKWSPGGFQIDPLTVTSDFGPGQVMAMSLPPKNGFASNVNVMAQPFAGTLEQYIDLSRKQFSDGNMKVLWERRAGETEWICEYQGSYSGHDLHWYGRAVITPGKAYLVTATAPEAEWPATGAQLKKCVDSFKVSP